MPTITVKQFGGGDFTTITTALASIGTSPGAGANYIVEVYNGTYLEGIINNLPSGTSWSAPFTIRVADGNTATIRNTGENNLRIYLPISLAFFSIIEGFIFDGANLFEGDNCALSASDSAPSSIRLLNNEFINTEWYNAIYIAKFANDIQIIGNHIHSGAFFGIGGLGRAHGIYMTGSNCLIEYNEIHDVPCFGIHNYYNGSAPYPSNNIIRYNEIYDCAKEVHVAAGILVTSGNGNECYGNWVYDILGADGDGGVGISVGGGSNQAYNNTVYGCTYQGIDAASSDNAIIRNNIAYLNGVNTEFTGATSLTESNNFVGIDPLFVNEAGRDFHLQAGSGAIDYGVDVGLAYEGAAPDAGAFEFEEEEGGANEVLPSAIRATWTVINPSISGGVSSANITPPSALSLVWTVVNPVPIVPIVVIDPTNRIRDSQNPIEVVRRDPGAIDDSQNPIEVVRRDPGAIDDSQNPIEVVHHTQPPPIRDSQNPIEAVIHVEPPQMNNSQMVIELVGRNLFRRGQNSNIFVVT